MKTKIYQAVQFVIGNATSYEGQLDYKISYDSMMKTWTVTAGTWSLVIDRDMVDELISTLATV